LQVDYTQFFDWSGVDCFDPAYPWVTSTINRTTIEEPAFAKFVIQQPFEQQAAAAAGYLLSQLHGYGRWATWYMANASITQNTTTTVSARNHVRPAVLYPGCMLAKGRDARTAAHGLACTQCQQGHSQQLVGNHTNGVMPPFHRQPCACFG
jgi:hypothetical protein